MNSDKHLQGSECLRGAFAPVLTPFELSGDPNLILFESHCRELLSQNCGLAVFGTTSEANSLSVNEKLRLLEFLASASIPSSRLIAGTGHCSIRDAIDLTQFAQSLGCAGVLMLPPFYYKDATDEGLFRFFAEVVEAVGDPNLRIYLYHIPQVAGVGFTHELIERLIHTFPKVIAGIKDSSGDFKNTRALLERFPDWGIFCGNELNLVEAMKLGAKGCISSTCNINGRALAHLVDNWMAPDAAERQKAANEVRSVIAGLPMIPALKAIVARATDEPAWQTVRPPLVALASELRSELYRRFDALGTT